MINFKDKKRFEPNKLRGRSHTNVVRSQMAKLQTGKSPPWLAIVYTGLFKALEDA